MCHIGACWEIYLPSSWPRHVDQTNFHYERRLSSLEKNHAKKLRLLTWPHASSQHISIFYRLLIVVSGNKCFVVRLISPFTSDGEINLISGRWWVPSQKSYGKTCARPTHMFCNWGKHLKLHRSGNSIQLANLKVVFKWKCQKSKKNNIIYINDALNQSKKSIHVPLCSKNIWNVNSK